jgi:Barstar (barnase inhibitor)
MSVAAHVRSTDPPWVALVVLPPGRALGTLLGEPGDLLVKTIRGRRCETKAGLLVEFARALEFPAYAAKNWDAFEECVTDLEWLPAAGYVIVVADAERLLIRREQDYATFIEIMQTAGQDWATARSGEWPRSAVPFHVLLAVAERHRAARANWRVPPLKLCPAPPPGRAFRADRRRPRRAR